VATITCKARRFEWPKRADMIAKDTRSLGGGGGAWYPRDMFEHRSEPLLPQDGFLCRALLFMGLSAAMIVAALGVGVVGYRVFGGLDWIDALVNASMILGGMGPVDRMTTHAGKLFTSFYALFSGLLFIGAASVVLAPFVHRILHRLHLDEGERPDGA
jgi:hypothetical protein